MSRRFLVSAALLVTVALPQVSFASELAAPIVIEAAPAPRYYIVPPTTDPEPVRTAVLGASSVRGIVEHGEGDLLLLNLGDELYPDYAVVRIPDGNSRLGNGRLPASSIPDGAYVEAIGTPSVTGILESLRVSIWLP